MREFVELLHGFDSSNGPIDVGDPSRPCPDGQETNPHRLAHEFLNTNFVFKGGVGLRYWRDEFHAWDGTAYQPVPGGEMRAQLTRWIADEFERLSNDLAAIRVRDHRP